MRANRVHPVWWYTLALVLICGFAVQGISADVPVQDYYEFSEDGKQCIIKRHDTPYAWLNLLSNDRFVAWVTHDGRIVESCLTDNQRNRLTNPDSGHVYILDHDSGEVFRLDRPSSSQEWESIQGMGYMTLRTTLADLNVELTYFVPRDDDVLLWVLNLENLTQQARRLDVFSVVEWSLGDRNFETVFPGGDFPGIHNNFKSVRYEDGLILGNNATWGIDVPGRFQGQKPWPYTGFFTSSVAAESFECKASRFYGVPADSASPHAVEAGACSSRPGNGFTEFPLGVQHHRIDLPSGESSQLVHVLGMVKDVSTAKRLREKYREPGAAEREFTAVKEFWTQFTDDSIVVDTPEDQIDRQINLWNKYQYRASMLQNQNTGRRGFGVWCAAYPYGGGRTSDLRETGNIPCDLTLIRDDILDYLVGGPLLLKSDLELKWRDDRMGEVNPMPYPGNGRGLWPYAVCWYVKETGDLSFLDEIVPGTDKTVFDRMQSTIEWSLSGLSERDLPLINAGFGDWDDALNLVSRDGRAESVLTAAELCYMLKECSEVASAFGKDAEAKQWSSTFERIKRSVNENAWDGNWYLRAFTDEGTPVGSHREEEGRIYLVAQAAAVLGGIAEGPRAQSCLQAVDDLLMTKYGPVVLAPPYTRSNNHIGIVTDFPPGWRENAGVWNRATGWAVMANCVAGRAEAAFRMYKSACLSSVSKHVEVFGCPPYAYPEYYVGAGEEQGRGQYQWCMGKAGTMWRAYVYYILGTRPVLDGLLIDPQIPASWDGFTVWRPFRNASYRIKVTNPNALNSGVSSMSIDGVRVDGNIVPAHSDGREHLVEIVLGT